MSKAATTPKSTSITGNVNDELTKARQCKTSVSPGSGKSPPKRARVSTQALALYGCTHVISRLVGIGDVAF
eukprot:CAMPEP_0180539054 /NCGR_PEP_ID=MMETSP1036_2-20121128/66683_1 /TAXON_ID=632150 /ORGANISM="Azadinium spinosum, Strain 3D9" /LENGTH=70 /DNA_ID=CAMNT_0022553767 /DNA_START=42 /DNA_END=251 /DNA_ORIENTATION=+